MKLPDAVKTIRSRYVARFPVPQTPGGGDDHEERCRQWSIRFAEQVAFELPGQGWGMKRADMGRPVSKDTVANWHLSELLAWDLLLGTGTGAPSLVDDPDSIDITGQVFVPVTPTNHLAGSGPTQPEIPPVTPSPDLSARVEALTREVADLGEHVGLLAETLDAVHRRVMALEGQAPPDISRVLERLQALETRQYRVRGSTSRDFGHGHRIDLPVEVIP